ncbi:hypothetical protein B0H14DRAFT_273216 [Mycena olivaceomarginata]|nr:hypothetical protein B0H14DRAFT_273216 [Mycena olivaceomarginata]
MFFAVVITSFLSLSGAVYGTPLKRADPTNGPLQCTDTNGSGSCTPLNFIDLATGTTNGCTVITAPVGSVLKIRSDNCLGFQDANCDGQGNVFRIDDSDKNDLTDKTIGSIFCQRNDA